MKLNIATYFDCGAAHIHTFASRCFFVIFNLDIPLIFLLCAQSFRFGAAYTVKILTEYVSFFFFFRFFELIYIYFDKWLSSPFNLSIHSVILVRIRMFNQFIQWYLVCICILRQMDSFFNALAERKIPQWISEMNHHDDDDQTDQRSIDT